MRVPRIVVDPFQPVDERFRVHGKHIRRRRFEHGFDDATLRYLHRAKTRRIDHPLGEIFGRGDAAARAPVRRVRFLW